MFIKFLSLDKVAYMIVAFLIVAYSYKYVDNNDLAINLPYKEQVLALEKLILSKVNNLIKNYSSEGK
jgi:hypothetical protein